MMRSVLKRVFKPRQPILSFFQSIYGSSLRLSAFTHGSFSFAGLKSGATKWAEATPLLFLWADKKRPSLLKAMHKRFCSVNSSFAKKLSATARWFAPKRWHVRHVLFPPASETFSRSPCQPSGLANRDSICYRPGPAPVE
jgi:hypothetical protein